MQKKIRKYTERDVPAVLKTIKSGKRVARIEAVEALATIRHVAVIPTLVALLNDRMWVIRETAAEKLGYLECKEAVVPLIHALSDRSTFVRYRSAESLGYILEGSREAPSALLRRLKDPNDMVRVCTAEALAYIGDRSALRALWRVVSDPAPLVRGYAVTGIGVLGRGKDVPRLRRRLAVERNKWVRARLDHALYMLGEREKIDELKKHLLSDRFLVSSGTVGVVTNWLSSKNAAEILDMARSAARMARSRNQRDRVVDLIKIVRRWMRQRAMRRDLK